MRLLAAEPALSVPVVDDCNKSSMEILFLIAWYRSFWRTVSGQYTSTSIYCLQKTQKVTESCPSMECRWGAHI